MNQLKSYLFWILVFLFFFNTVEANAQITLNVKNTEIKDILKRIERQSDYSFFYSENYLDINKKVNLSIRNATIVNTLNQLFTDTNIQYTIHPDKLIVLTPKKSENNLSVQTLQKSKVIVQGTVLDEKGVGLIGVKILEKGNLNNGTITGSDGKFTLLVNENAVLLISYVGFNPEEISTENERQFDIVMTEDTKLLDEVVVTALGITQNKRNLTYSTQSVDLDNMTKSREINIANSLSGKIAGLDIVKSSSGLNSGTRVVFRGDRSFGSSEALVIIDGVPGNLGNVSPDNIASINTLKGASASALYGSEAMNGVIMITTKKGSQDNKYRISLNSVSQFENVVPLREYQNVYAQGSEGKYIKSAEGAWGPIMTGQTEKHWSLDPADMNRTYELVPHPNNYRDFFSTGTIFTNNLAIRGGNENLNAYLSYTNTVGKGIIDNNSLIKNNFNLRVGGLLLEKLTFDTKFVYQTSNSKNDMVSDDNFLNVNRQISRVPSNIALEDIKHYEYYDVNSSLKHNYWNPVTNGGENPYWVKYNTDRFSNWTFAETLASLKYDFNPELSLLLRNGTAFSHNNQKKKVHFNTFVVAVNGSYSLSQMKASEITSDFLLSYNPKIGDLISLNTNFGGMRKYSKSELLTAGTSNLVLENIFSLPNTVDGSNWAGEAFSEREKQSLYGSIDFGFKDFLFINMTGRNDWSSTLPRGEWSYFYPSLGGALIFSELFSMPKAINLLKIRGSVARTGSDMGPYNTLQYYSVSHGGTIVKSDTRVNDNLKPEMTTAREAGLDISAFGELFNLNVTVYKTNSENQLIRVLTPPASGYAYKLTNAGNIENKGIEVILKSVPVRTRNFSWTIDANYSANRNKVIEISPTVDEYVLRSDWMVDTKIVTGRPFGEMYSKGFERDEYGRILIMEDGRPLTTTARTVYLGNSRPKWLGGLSNSFAYKDFGLSFFITARMGARISSFTDATIAADGLLKNSLEGRDGFIVDGVKESGAPNNKSITSETYWSHLGGRNNPIGELFTYDASNIRLREVVLSYSLPKSILERTFINNASISLIGQNLFFLMNKAKNFDSELVVGTGNGDIGIESFSPPFTRTYSVNLLLNF